MKPFLALLFVAVLFVPAAESHAGHGPPHSESIYAAVHAPNDPQRGQDVHVTVVVEPRANVTEARLIYCRVQQYACGPPARMTKEGLDRWTATIAWNRPSENRRAEFWNGVTDVGYNVTLVLANGTEQTSPLENWPSTPAGYVGDGHYYFYKIPPGKESPGPGSFGLLVLVAAAGLFILRRRPP